MKIANLKNKNSSQKDKGFKPKLSQEERAAKRLLAMERAKQEAARLDAKRLLEDKSFIDLYNQYAEKGAPVGVHFLKLPPWLNEDLRLVAFYGAYYASLSLLPAPVRKAFNDAHERFFVKVNALYELLSIGRTVADASDRRMILDTALAEFWKSYSHLRKAQSRVVSTAALVGRLKVEVENGKNTKEYLDSQQHHLTQAHKSLGGELSALIRMAKHTETLLTSTLRGYFISRDKRFSSYESVFEGAHRLGREHVAVLGPTNSGKTHEAMEALKASSSGIYLAPLRLLALENFERLQSAGLKARLETGEESLGAPRESATHYAMTVEKCPFEREFDVAVIDEVQMLADSDRGAAWTAAILGIKAKKIYLLGSAASKEVLMRLASLSKERISFVFKERLSPLKIETKPVRSAKDLLPGDALITFSRDGVLRTKQLLRNSGLKASVIYGGLSPEVRRAETERFRLGETDVVIATDAIGMGLNLPIRRVIFLETQKYNGEEVVDLTHSQFLQIAGRAGRYALSNGVVTGETGLAAVIGQGDVPYLQKALSKDMQSLPLTSLVAEPLMLHINVLSEELRTDNLVDILDAFTYRSGDDSIRRYISPSLAEGAAILEDMLDDLAEERQLNYPMSLPQKFFLARLPLRLNEESHYEFFNMLIRSLAVRGTHLRPEEAFIYLDRTEHVDLKSCELERGLVTAYLHLPLDEEERAHTITYRLDLDRRSESLLSQGKGAKESDKIAWPTICEKCGRSMGKPSNFKTCRPCFSEGRRRYED